MLLLLIIACSAPAFAALPEYIQACSRNSSDFDECILNRTMTIMPYVGKGIPELNLPVLDPLFVPMVKLEQGSGSVKLKLTLNNLKVYGLGQYLFREIRVVLDASPYISGSIWVPGLHLEAEYDIDGKILLVPLKGKGYMNLNTTNTMGNFNVGLLRKEIGGKNYLEAMDFELKLKIDDVKIKLDSLFGGSQLGNVTAMFVRENSKQIFHEVKPAVESVAAMVASDIFSRALKSHPEEVLFPYN